MIITLSGQAGAGAREIGQQLAGELELDDVDWQILVDAARRLGVTVGVMADRDERTLTLGERLTNFLHAFLERSAMASAGDPFMSTAGLEVILARTYSEAASEPQDETPYTDDAKYVKTLTAIMKELAQRGNMVVLGRGSQVILKDHPAAIHVLTIAPKDLRIMRYSEREHLNLEVAAKKVAEIDKGRVAFHNKFFKVEVNDPRLYHVVLNTGRINYEKATEMIAALARR